MTSVHAKARDFVRATQTWVDAVDDKDIEAEIDEEDKV